MTSSPVSSPQPRSRSRRWWWVAAVTTAFVLALRIALPGATAWVLEREGTRALGLDVTVENVDYGILQGRLALEGVRVAGDAQDREEPLLAWRRLSLDFEWLRILAGEWAIARLRFEGPSVALLQDAEGHLIIPVAAPPEPTGDAPAPDPGTDAATREDPDGGWPVAIGEFALDDVTLHVRDAADRTDSLMLALEAFRIGDVRIHGGRIGLGSIFLETPSLRFRTDRLPSGVTGPRFVSSADPEGAEDVEPRERSPGHRIDALHIEEARVSLASASGEPLEIDLKLSAQDVAIEPGHRFPVALELGIGTGSLALEGRATIAPPAFEGALRWSALPLPALIRPAGTPIGAWMRSGKSEGQLDVALQLGAPEEGEALPLARLSGTARVTEFEFAEPEGDEPRVAWSALTIDAREVVWPAVSSPPSIALESVELVRPQVTWLRPADALRELFGDSGAEVEPTESGDAESKQTPLPQVRIARIKVSEGEFSIADSVVSPPFRDEITEFDLTTERFQLSPRSVERIRAQGRSLGGGPFTVTGDVKPGASDVRLRLIREGLLGYDGYARQYAGYGIGRGALSVDIDVKQRGEATVANNEITLHDLRVQPQGEDAFRRLFGVPIGLALALLRDSKGDIRLSVPVEMDERGIQAGVAPLLYDSFRQAVSGALASPLKTLGFAFQAGGQAGAIEDLRKRAFAPGTAELTVDAQARAKRIAALLTKRPELRLEMRGAVAEADRRPLAEQRLLALHRSGADWPALEGLGFLVRRRIAAFLEEQEIGGQGELSEEDRAILVRLADAVEVTSEQRGALAEARAQSAWSELVEKNGTDPTQVGLRPGPGESESGLEVELTLRREEDAS